MTAGGGGYGGGEICKGELVNVVLIFCLKSVPEGVLVLVMVVLMFGGWCWSCSCWWRKLER